MRRLEVARRKFHRTVDTFVRGKSWLFEIQVLADRAECILAIRNARSVGLGQLADRYQRILDAEVKRVDEFRAFSALLRNANAYGERGRAEGA